MLVVIIITRKVLFLKGDPNLATAAKLMFDEKNAAKKP
jgi:hypothetical protein